jgi:hypothetical protein
MANSWFDTHPNQKEARMPSSSSHLEDTPPKRTKRTLAEIVIPVRNPTLRRDLEEFRIKYEAEFGETDLTKRYTSTLSAKEQDWLIANHTKRYWDGLPPFVQAFFKEKMHAARSDGKLDDMPANMLRLYLTRQMSVGETDHWR